MLDGSDDGEVNALAITNSGEHFVSGGEDKQLKLWGYDEGMQQYVGNGHAGSIVKLQFSPDQRFIISVGDEGSINFIISRSHLYMEDSGRRAESESRQPNSQLNIIESRYIEYVRGG